jgi:hypothetical protein
MTRFNAPPGWPQPPAGWAPPPGWNPDPAWPPMPEGWQLWLPDVDEDSLTDPYIEAAPVSTGREGEGPGRPAAPTSATEEPRRAPVAGMPTVPAAPDAAQTAPAAPAVASPAETSALLRRIADLEAALATQPGGSEVIELNDQRVLQGVGIYRYHHPLEDAAAYRDRLAHINGSIDDVVRANRAVLAADLFTFDGSLARAARWSPTCPS